MKTNPIKRIITLATAATVTLAIGAGGVFAQGGTPFTTRIINNTSVDWTCSFATSNGYHSSHPYTHEIVNKGATKDFALACQSGIDCFEVTKSSPNWQLSSGDLGPQCWSRNIYLREDSKNSTFYWEWTTFH